MMTRRSFRITLAAVFSSFIVLPASSADPSSDQVVENWLKSNSGASKLKISYTQTQSMKTVKTPIFQRGTLWLDTSSKKFRLESGKTIVTGNSSEVTIQRTNSKEYEIRAAGSGAPGMAALSKGFPKTLSDFNSKYKVLKVTKGSGNYAILTKPLGSASKGVKTFTFKVNASSFKLEGIALVLSDGSTVNTNFTNIEVNPPVDSDQFKPNLEGYSKTKFGD